MQVLILPWECVTQLTRTPGCDNVAVVYAGRIIEYADKRELFKDPKHPYTHGLFGSLPSMTKGEKRLKPIAGSPPDPTELPEGCAFAPRCPRATDNCRKGSIPLTEIKPGHLCRCVNLQ